MKLQKATLYGVLSVLELARDRDRQLSAADIGARYGISTHHLSKVLRTLGRSGLVEASRGVGGGYRFVGNARRTTLLEIVELFEPVTNPDEHPELASTQDGRALRSILHEIDDTARYTLGAITVGTALSLGERFAVDDGRRGVKPPPKPPVKQPAKQPG